MSDALRAIIEASMAEIDPASPETDNQEGQKGDKTDEEYTVDEGTDSSESETPDDTVETESDEAEDSADEETEDVHMFTVKVDGEELQVPEDELIAGYQRQGDYTRKTQALKAEREEFEASKQEVSEKIDAIIALDTAWDNSPLDVLTHFTLQTDNPAAAVTGLIARLASSNMSNKARAELQDLMNTFGITPEIQGKWLQDSTLDGLRQTNEAQNRSREQELEDARNQLEITRIVAEYESQIDSIIEDEDLNFTTKQRNAFRQELAQYAADNEITNLKTAYKAFKYEEAKKTSALSTKVVEKAKAKKAASAVTRTSGGAGNSTDSSQDIQDIIRQAMKEVSGQ